MEGNEKEVGKGNDFRVSRRAGDHRESRTRTEQPPGKLQSDKGKSCISSNDTKLKRWGPGLAWVSVCKSKKCPFESSISRADLNEANKIRM